MFMGHEKEGKTLAFFLVARERATKAVLSAVVPRKSRGTDLPKADGMASSMIIDNSLVGSSTRNGIVQRTIQSVHGVTRTICSAIEEHGR